MSEVEAARELTAVLTICFSHLVSACNSGFSIVGGASLNTSHPPLPSIDLKDEDLPWFASSQFIGFMAGNLLGGYCGGRLGARRSLLASCVLAGLGWLTISSSPSLALLVLGRVVCGVSAGFSSSNGPILVAQYSRLERTGGFLALLDLSFYLGVLITCFLGSLLHWRIVALIPPLLYLLLFLSLWRIPESPVWLLSHRGKEQCRDALVWLRGTEDVTEEIIQIEESKEQQSHGLTMTEAVRNLARPDIRTPFLLVTINYLLVLSPFTIIVNSAEEFQYLSSISVTTILVLSATLGVFLTQSMARRPLFLLTTSLMSVLLAGLGGCMFLKTRFVSPLLDILPVLSVIVYLLCFGAGAGPLTVVYLGEMLPREYNLLAGVVIFVSNLSVFLMTKMFPSLLVALSPQATCWLFAGVCLASNFFFIFFMPETKGKHAGQIKKMFLKIEN